MLSMALELASDDPAYEDVASKFFEHFVAIADAMNTLGGTGLWDEAGRLLLRPAARGRHRRCRLRVRSMVGLIPLFAVRDHRGANASTGCRASRSACEWFLDNRPELARHISYMVARRGRAREHAHRLLAIPSRERLERVLRYVLDETEFLSPYGMRSRVARAPRAAVSCFGIDGEEYRVAVRARRVDDGHVRRQLELARAGVVSDQLSADRGARALRPLLRRLVPSRVPDGIGTHDDAQRGGA